MLYPGALAEEAERDEWGYCASAGRKRVDNLVAFVAYSFRVQSAFGTGVLRRHPGNFGNGPSLNSLR